MYKNDQFIFQQAVITCIQLAKHISSLEMLFIAS